MAKTESHFRIRYDKVDRNGNVSLRYDSRLLHIGLGARHEGTAAVLVIADRDVRVGASSMVVAVGMAIPPVP